MKKLLMSIGMTILTGVSLSGCTDTDSRVAGYTTGGAALGALAGAAVAHDTGKGALAGGAIGGALGALTATAQNNNNYYNNGYYSGNAYNNYPSYARNMCMYRDRYGRNVVAPCRY